MTTILYRHEDGREEHTIVGDADRNTAEAETGRAMSMAEVAHHVARKLYPDGSFEVVE